MWMYLWQLLSDASCNAIVAMAIAYCNEIEAEAPGVDSGGYVRARNKIAIERKNSDLVGVLPIQLEYRNDYIAAKARRPS